MSGKARPVIARAAERPREGWGDTTRGDASWFTLFSSPMTPTASMSAGIMEILPNGGRLKPHRHEQPEIYFVIEGLGTLTIDDVVTELTAGSAAFIPGHAEHGLHNESNTVLKIFYVFPTDSFADVMYRFPD